VTTGERDGQNDKGRERVDYSIAALDTLINGVLLTEHRALLKSYNYRPNTLPMASHAHCFVSRS